MATAVGGISLTYTDINGCPKSIKLSDNVTFTEITQQDLIFAGAASQAINLGTMSGVYAAAIYAASGDIGVKVNAGTTATPIGDKGLYLVTGTALTAVQISHAAAAKATVTLLGGS